MVKAATMDQAWEVATDSDEWELLEFEVSKVMIFPKDPTQL